MSYKIVVDSSSDTLTLDRIPFATVPLYIIVGDQSFTDDATIDLNAMQQALSSYKGKTSTACPAPQDWIDAFDEEEVVFCVTITGGLSGSNASANAAKEMYESQHPGRKVYVIDSLSTGPEVTLLTEKLRELILEGYSHEIINQKIMEYHKHTHLLFSLASLQNLARNGRVNALVAKGVGILGIRIIGKASDKGTLETTDKARGDKKAILRLTEAMKKMGYTNGKVIIGHNQNETAALALKKSIEDQFGKTSISIQITRGLDSYYAEPQSLLIGFEA